MNEYQFNQVTEQEYEVIILCTEVMQRNINCFDDLKGRLLVGGSIENTVFHLKEKQLLSPSEFLSALHSIELCALALRNLENINPNDLRKIKPYKKVILGLHKTYGTLLYMFEPTLL